MLRVSEQYAASDTGRQRRANEDSLLARAPLFVVADGMGGAQAGEVASRIAVESFQPGLPESPEPELALAALARSANSRIHDLAEQHAEQAGMGTTLTAVYVGEEEVSIAHVGDSRAYCLRDGELLRLTDDHSLVDELMRQGRLTPEEALEHPQRSVITRALGPESTVEVDTRSFRARDGDVYLICSDGLTTMLPDEQICELLLENARLADAGRSLIAAANAAGGRDNITVVLLRLEDLSAGAADREQDTASTPALGPATAAAGAAGAAAGAQGAVPELEITGEPGPDGAGAGAAAGPPTVRLTPRRPGRGERAGARSAEATRRRRRRGLWATSAALVLALFLAAGYLATQSVYFIGTNQRGLVTMYRGLPWQLPAGINLYNAAYISGVGASTLAPSRRTTLLDHSLRSEADAAALVRSLELGQIE